MGSNDVDDFVLNFDLNQLSVEENIQSPDKKYEKIRKNTSWLKSKIISTDFVIQKYQSKKELYEQSVKAHSATKEELRQACINYNDAIQKCGNLENENKLLLTNQEVLKGKATDLEHKYEALLSHTNQLQMLVKQLENEKDALSVEKELDKSSNIDINKEIKALKKEKDTMLNDIIVFKDIILGKRKTSKNHIKLLKKYVKDIKSTAKILSTCGESDDESNNYGDKSLCNKKTLDRVHIIGDKTHVSNPELNFIDISSDEEVSVDTGRGSSRANSNDKYLSSPDYVVGDVLETPPKNFIKQIDAANSPIKAFSLITVATSPITFEQPDPIIEDQDDDYAVCYDGTEYINDEVPLSEEINELVEAEKMADCASPVKEQREIIDKESKSTDSYKFIFVECDDDTSSNKLPKGLNEKNEFEPDLIIEKQLPSYMCQNTDTVMRNDKKLIDACTSPRPLSPDLRKFVDIGTSTHEHDKSLNLVKSFKFGIPTSRNKDKPTDILVLSDKRAYVNDFKIPVAKSRNRSIVHVGTNTDTNMSVNYENSTMSKQRNLVDVSTSPILLPHKQREVIDIEARVASKEQTEKRKRRRSLFSDQEDVMNEQESSSVNKKRSSNVRDNTITNPQEKLITQEKVCLETNSSKSLRFERTNDTEVQNILNVMKLHHDLISPISETPSSSHYLKLIPEMNSTLSKIWNTLSSIYKIPNQLSRNERNSLTCPEIDLSQEISEEDINNSNCEQPPIVRPLTQVAEGDILDTTNGVSLGINNNISTYSTSSGQTNMISSEVSKVSKSSRTKSDVFGDKLVLDSRTDTIIVIAEEGKRNPKQVPKTITDSNENFEDNINNGNKINEEILVGNEGNNKGKSYSHKDRITNSFESNEICKYNNTINTDNNNETSNISGKPAVYTILRKDAKTKKKTKLEKFRDKLLPTCKIKKITPLIKHPTKTYIKPRDTTTLSLLNQKEAYEHAVKVMAELRSTRELQESKARKVKPLTYIKEDKNLSSKSSKIEWSPSETIDQKMLSTKIKPNKIESSSSKPIDLTLSTRSRTRGSCKKDEDTSLLLTPEQNISNIDQSPAKRKRRKRPADTEVESIQTSSKRVLRSSHVIQDMNDVLLPLLNRRKRNDSEKNNKLKGNVKNPADSPSGHCKFTDNNMGNNFNLNTESCGSRNKLAAAKSDILKKNVIQSKKPVIEISECLVDNDNLVSIIPGKVGYLDVKKNTNDLEKSNNSTVDNHIEQQDINLSQQESSKVSKELKNASFTNTKEYKTDDQRGNKEPDREHDSIPMIRTEQILHVYHNDIAKRKEDMTKSLIHKLQEEAKISKKNPVVQLTPCVVLPNVINYSDLEMFTAERNVEHEKENTSEVACMSRNKNVLCNALDRKAPIYIRYFSKKVPDSITFKISQELEKSIAKIVTVSKNEQKKKLNELVNNIQSYNMKCILSGFMKFLKDPTRKSELYNKLVIGLAPPMTKSEIILLYVIQSLNKSWPDFANKLLNTIEYALFQLNRAPEFDVIECLSHFFAVLCKYFRNKSRLRCFILDSMYCLQYKAIPLIRQCLDVYPRLLPNSQERMAKTSLVTCLVYLLHFYKCQDRYNRAQDIRNILYQRYHYRFSEWNENMILQIFRKAIMDLRGTQNDKNMLRIALIILCKRNGAKWCQVNIVQNMLLSIIDKKDVPDKIKQFGVIMLGPLLKPFPTDRKAQCEIVINQLLQMAAQDTSHMMKEAIYSSLIFMNKHDQDRVVGALLTWCPETVSPEFEGILNDYVMEKPLVVWKKLVVKNCSRSS